MERIAAAAFAARSEALDSLDGRCRCPGSLKSAVRRRRHRRGRPPAERTSPRSVAGVAICRHGRQDGAASFLSNTVDRRPVSCALEFVRPFVLGPLRRVSRGRQLVRLRLGSRAKASRRVDAARLAPPTLVTSRATVAARTAARTSALRPPPRASGPAAAPMCAKRAVFRRAAPRASAAATLAPPLTNLGRASVARGGVETVGSRRESRRTAQARKQRPRRLGEGISEARVGFLCASEPATRSTALAPQLEPHRGTSFLALGHSSAARRRAAGRRARRSPVLAFICAKPRLGMAPTNVRGRPPVGSAPPYFGAAARHQIRSARAQDFGIGCRSARTHS